MSSSAVDARRARSDAAGPGDGVGEFRMSTAQRNVFLGLILGMLVSSISQTIVGPAMPRIVAQLGGMEHYSWIATAAMLASAIVVPIVGKLSDMYGRRGFYIAGLVIFMVGSALSGFADNFWFLVGARAVQGIGMGCLQPLSQTIIGDIIPARSRGKYQGIMGAVFGVTSVLGPLAGGWITDNMNWRWLFFLPIPVGLVALYFIIRFLHLPHTALSNSFDLWGSLSLVPALVLVLLATTWGGNQYAWGSATIIGMYAAGAVFLGLFVWAEFKAVNPLLPLRLFSQNIFTMSVLASFLLSVAMFGAIIYIPVFAQVVLSASATNSGVILMPLSVAMIIVSIVVGMLITRTGRYKGFMIGGLVVMLVGYLGLTTLSADSSKLALSGLLVVIGIGLGLSMQVFTLVVQNNAKRAEMGIATSAVQFFRNLGSTVGTAVLGTVMSSSLQENIMSHVPAAARAKLAASGASIDAGSALDTSKIGNLPPMMLTAVRGGMADSMHSVFLTALPFIAIAIVLTLFIKNKPLRTTVYDTEEERIAATAAKVDATRRAKEISAAESEAAELAGETASDGREVDRDDVAQAVTSEDASSRQ
ncbi:MFS transporter [Acidipropionibacterium acidipropionici]|uniref:Multidrug transporter n=1 Tax=Acidipropionibacterium acidipropionici TaxID=1748 RepID=A0AAC8YDM2_9ACTN|nr:MDR family MFS transporter [Acidipropionibacterium acidipropionici]AMS04717.1 multidrug transporter [Acidipropionibacterium acidipropionici]AOZ46208.1 multidrug transporter [Acidipropionibacterium acidipropionici]AZP37767.1 MFS transporter [Acidipropionibacterium acidipropionici]QCV95185.1 MFS transporter [Acidipropionibacterium acidipropionici]